jgi:hypothetical protein
MGGGTRLLQHARQLVDRGWTQHADARASDKSSVHPWDNRATTWSLLVAAVERIAATDDEHTAISELARTCIHLADTLDTDSLEHWNDAPDRTREDVLSALDHATFLSESRQDGQSPRGLSPN